MTSKSFLVDIDMGGNKVTSLADPSSATDAVNLQYLENFVKGRSYKDPVRAASTTNVTLATPGSSMDGVTLSSNDRLLLKNQTNGAENGIYVWTGAASALTRATDADSSAEVKGGMVVGVVEGTTNGDREFMLTTDGAITLGTTSLTFTALVGSGVTYSAGNGLQLSSTTFSVVPNGTSIDVSASGVKIADAAGGAGLTVASGILAVGAGTGVTVNANDVAVDTSLVARWKSATAGNGSATALTLTHNLGNANVLAQAIDASTKEEIECNIVRTNTTSVTFTFQTAPATNSVILIAVG